MARFLHTKNGSFLIKEEIEDDDEAFNVPNFEDYYKKLLTQDDEPNPFTWKPGKLLTKDVRRLILSCHLNVHRKYKGTMSATQVNQETANLLGISAYTVGNIIKIGNDCDTPGRKKKFKPRKRKKKEEEGMFVKVEENEQRLEKMSFEECDQGVVYIKEEKFEEDSD